MSKACETFDDDLRGNFYNYEFISDDLKVELNENNYLFKNEDKFLDAGNFHYDWPSGRAVYVNYFKNLIIWVNELDHIKIISIGD